MIDFARVLSVLPAIVPEVSVGSIVIGIAMTFMYARAMFVIKRTALRVEIIEKLSCITSGHANLINEAVINNGNQQKTVAEATIAKLETVASGIVEGVAAKVESVARDIAQMTPEHIVRPDELKLPDELRVIIVNEMKTPAAIPQS